MTEVLQSPSHFPSPSSSSPPTTSNDGPYPHALSPSIGESLQAHLGSEEEEERKRSERDREGDQLSLLTLLVAAFRKSLIGCSTSGAGVERAKLSNMEIGWPSNVRHVAHVTFDRFNGFLGLPVELEPEVPRRAPSARCVFAIFLGFF